jgi:SRSO17 transposase
MFNQIERNLAYIIPLFRSTGKKNCSNLARTNSKTTAKKLLQFLKESPLSIIDFAKIINLHFAGKLKYLIIDDTIIPKKYSKNIVGSSDNYDHSEKKTYRSICSMAALITDGITGLPIDQKLWVAEDNAQESYKSKCELAQELIFEIKKYVDIEMVLMDGIFATKEMIQSLIKHNILFELRIHANRNIQCENGEKGQLKNLQQLDLNYKKHRTAKGFWAESWLYFTSVKRETKKGRIIITYQVSNYKAPGRTHVRNYGYRWKIEIFFRTAKQSLGLKDCQSRDFDIQQNHILQVFLAYVILQIQRRKSRFKNTERALRALKHKSHDELICRINRLDRIFSPGEC